MLIDIDTLQDIITELFPDGIDIDIQVTEDRDDAGVYEVTPAYNDNHLTYLNATTLFKARLIDNAVRLAEENRDELIAAHTGALEDDHADRQMEDRRDGL